jgi:hypothetical protein
VSREIGEGQNSTLSEMKAVSDNQKLRESVTSAPAVQEMLKEFLQGKGN